ncbi:MAG TPA: hypothetical protein VEW68_09640 [Patescibacteria group bacterium]|nr:hypothetical protein [Patescibacteria group bacterium]
MAVASDGVYCHKTMAHLPEGFADDLARVLDPRDHQAAAEIIEAAAMLDDKGLARFLRLFAARVRRSAALIRSEELLGYLQQAAGGA